MRTTRLCIPLIRSTLGTILLAGASVLTLAATSGAAQATAITSASNFTIDWSVAGGTTQGANTLPAGVTLSANAVFSNFQIDTTANTVTFNLDVTNTSTGTTPGNDARFTSFGWVTQPNATAATNDSSVYASTTNTTLSGTSLSVCLYSGSNCNGGSTGGLEDPNNTGLHNDPTTTGTFTVMLSFGSNPSPPLTQLTFSNYYGKFQTAWGSFEEDGYSSCTGFGCSPPPQVPEPSSLSLFGTGLIGLGALFIWAERRRRKATA